MRVSNILVFLVIAIVLFAVFSAIFRKPYYANVITAVRGLNFQDTIEYVYDYKDDNGPGIKTKFLHRDTAYCFSGYSETVKVIYPDYAMKNDLLLKATNSDSFYIKRGDTLIGFVLTECH